MSLLKQTNMRFCAFKVIKDQRLFNFKVQAPDIPNEQFKTHHWLVGAMAEKAVTAKK